MKKLYIGTKMIHAIAMTRLDYNNLRGWTLPANEDGNDKGYLVEYLDGGAANVPGFSGYVSWSPDAVFDTAYKSTEGLTFGLAVEALKMGSRVTRAGWNGRGMWLVLVPGRENVNFTDGSPYMRAGLTSAEILPHIDMYTTNSSGRKAMLPGWVASQSDILATDWIVLEG